MKFSILSLIVAATLPVAAETRSDIYAPIGVMGDHLHTKGKLMASYRYMFMSMDRNYDGSSSLSPSEVLEDPSFMVSPTDMDMEMHMFGLMYSPTDKLTFMAMLNLVELSMNHVRADGLKFNTRSSGVGDSSIGALYRFNDHFHGGLSLLLPTAKVNRRGFIPGPGETQLPYPMQLGAGTWGISPTLTYRSFFKRWSFGSQLSARFQFGENDQGYRLGERYEFTTWAAVPIGESFSLSFRTTLSDWDNIEGVDEDLLNLPVPTVRADLRGGTRVDASLGLNYRHPGTGIGLGVELGKTLWQDLAGPQLGSDWTLNAGVRLSF